MPVIKAGRSITTTAGEVIPLATPSLGSADLSSWRVRMPEGAAGPVHAIDREQVWMPLAGAFQITLDGDTSVVGPGEAAVLPAGTVRQIRTPQGPAEAIVCMPSGGTASVPGNPERRRIPWAE